MNSEEHTYSGGAEEVIDRWNSRRDPFVFYKEDLPALTVDLSVLKTTTVTELATVKQAHEPKKNSTWAMKRRLIAREFVGLSELSYLNAQLIANLRRSDQPEHAAALFRRLWEEESEHLISELDLRWQVSSIMTFADHGETLAERELGLGLKMLFGMIKLYEFERLFSGLPPTQPWRFGNRTDADMPLQMEHYSLGNGGLDIALLAPLWQTAKNNNVAGPLACNLLEAVNAEHGTVFHRLTEMKARRLKLRAKKTKT